ncbi:MAG TPA: hypothetical protein DEP59_07555, partial [Moraxella sp.]|nr:hypothetical protein [Moraxella sp.]
PSCRRNPLTLGRGGSQQALLIQPFIDGFLTAIALFFANCTNYNAYAPNVAKMRYAVPRMRSPICRMIDL